MAASLTPIKPREEWRGTGRSEDSSPNDASRTISYIGPVRHAQRSTSLTRTAMVAATVAAVASSAVLVPGLVGAASRTGEYPTVPSAAKASVSTSASVSAPISTAAAQQVFTGEGGAPGINYVVKPGDTLHEIAGRYGISTLALIQANNLANPDLIFPGQHVNVPAAGGAEDVTVEVKPGDTVNKLAQQYGVQPSSIFKLASNKIANPNLIFVGQKLVIPGATKSPDTASLASASAPKPAEETKPQAQAPATQPAPAAAQTTPAPAPASTPAPAPAATQGFVWPVKGTITQKFGPTSFSLEPAYMGYAHFHQGLDIANAMYTPIHAAAAGTVISAGWNNYGYGFCVQIDNGNGVVTLYGHMAQQPSVSAGQHVEAGQLIGKMGSTGASTGSHLHFAVKKNGVWVNPLNYLP